jgi:hypothetical protein
MWGVLTKDNDSEAHIIPNALGQRDLAEQVLDGFTNLGVRSSNLFGRAT